MRNSTAGTTAAATVRQMFSVAAADLNPVEGIWSLPRRAPLANTAFTDAAHLTRTLRCGLRQIQYRPDLLDGCLAETGLRLSTGLAQRVEQAVSDLLHPGAGASRCGGP
ncbi:hypothetical protein [Streptomyces sp. NPDC059455]|uniref:hypothetical protein n=1 Tax=Streptomyces sp. NPDC059455 TaxID=3346837 RepID=UPI0036A6196B